MTQNAIDHTRDITSTDLPYQIANLQQVRTGQAMPFTREQQSAINKSPTKVPTEVNYLGLVTDEQADRRHHGGHLKAIHQMSTKTYDRLNEAFGLRVEPGLLGENLITTPTNNAMPMTEANVCIGDIYQYGDTEDCVQLIVVQPRRPCYKINDQIGVNTVKTNIASWISRQGISGWYFKVVKQGVIQENTPVYLVDRPYPFATLAALWKLTNEKNKVNETIIAPWLDIACLEDSWKKALAKKIL